MWTSAIACMSKCWQRFGNQKQFRWHLMIWNSWNSPAYEGTFGVTFATIGRFDNLITCSLVTPQQTSEQNNSSRRNVKNITVMTRYGILFITTRPHKLSRRKTAISQNKMPRIKHWISWIKRVKLWQKKRYRGHEKRM